MLLLVLMVGLASAQVLQQDDNKKDNKTAPKAQPKARVEDESIPDSLLHARWRIQHTAPVVVEDLDSSALDLRMQDNIKLQLITPIVGHPQFAARTLLRDSIITGYFIVTVDLPITSFANGNFELM